MRILLPTLLLLFFFSFKADSLGTEHSDFLQGQNGIQFPSGDQFSKSSIEYQIFQSNNKTFGYDILADGKILIHQSTIPGQSGNQGFKTKSDAKKVAEIVVSKILAGQMPPSVSIEEMQKAGAIK